MPIKEPLHLVHLFRGIDSLKGHLSYWNDTSRGVESLNMNEQEYSTHQTWLLFAVPGLSSSKTRAHWQNAAVLVQKP